MPEELAGWRAGLREAIAWTYVSELRLRGQPVGNYVGMLLRAHTTGILEKVEVPLNVRKAKEEPCFVRLPLEGVRYLEGIRRASAQNRLDLPGPLPGMGAQPGGQDIHRGEGSAVTREHDPWVECDQPRQAPEVFDHAATTPEIVVGFQAGHRDDAR